MGEFASRKEIAVALKSFHGVFAHNTVGNTLKDNEQLTSLKGLISSTDLLNKNISKNKRTFLNALEAEKIIDNAVFLDEIEKA